MKIPRLDKKQKMAVAAVVVFVVLVTLTQCARAGGNHSPTIIFDPGPQPETTSVTNVTEVTEVTNINKGASNSDVAKAASAALAGAAHKMDYNYSGWQGSVTGSYYDDENALSVGVGKRVQKVLLHGAYTDNGDEYGAVVGATFRF